MRSISVKPVAGIASTLSEIAEKSAMCLKLTPESSKRLKDAGGRFATVGSRRGRSISIPVRSNALSLS